MAAWTAPLLVASILLVVAGAPKAVDPVNTVGALRSVGLRTPATVIRLFGASEALLGIATLWTGARPLAALVSLSYTGFSAFLVVALRSGGAVSSCGCIGRSDTPPTRSHLTVTTVLALAAAAAAMAGADGLSTIGWSAMTLPAIGFALLGSWLVWLVFTALPRLLPRES